MPGSSKAFKIVVLLAGILLIGMLVGWWTTRKNGTSAQFQAPQISSTKEPSADRLPFFSTNSRPHPVANPGPSNRSAAGPSSNTNTNVMADWEDKLEEILGSDAEESIKAQQLLALFPRLPADGQIEVAQHLSNLVADQDYASLGKLLVDPKESEEVLDVLMVDVLNRPNTLKLPLLLEIAREPQHPKSAEAKDLLELYLEQDYGTDWNKWQSKVDQWLKDNPD